jgi:hypothetical protein
MSDQTQTSKPGAVPLDVLARGILVRIDKARMETRSSKAQDFRISAGYCLVEAQERVAAGEAGGLTWPEWITRFLNKPLGQIDALIRLIAAPQPINQPRASTPQPYTPPTLKERREAWVNFGWTNSRNKPGNVWREANLWRVTIFKRPNDGLWGVCIAMELGENVWSPMGYERMEVAKTAAFEAVEFLKARKKEAA